MGVRASERDDYFLWREWVLGEERFRGRGPRSMPRPNVGYGDPKRGQKKVPDAWWEGLEAFLVRRNDHRERGRGGQVRPPVPPAIVTPTQLTEHFHVREFACKDGRQVPQPALAALTALCRDFLEPLRAEYGPCLVMSGYRPEDYNRRIGGARFSQHIYELTPDSVAADVIFAKGRPIQWHRSAEELRPGGLGLYGSFIHVDNRPGISRWVG